MGSELESTGNGSISSNNWILVGQFRSVETKMRQSLLLICSKLTKQIRIVLTVLCGVQVWTCGLMHIRLVLLLRMCQFCVCTCVPTYVYLWVWMLVYLCEFSIEGQRQLGALFLRGHPLCFFETVFRQEPGLADYTRLASWSAIEPPGSAWLCLPSTVVTCLAFPMGAGDGTWVFILVGRALNSPDPTPLFIFRGTFCKLCKMR